MFVPLLLCCTQEESEPICPGGGKQIVITAGFEQQAPAGAQTKTYVAGGSEIRWSSAGIDKVIYVFDSAGNKNVFTSTSTTAEAVRTFTGTITDNSTIEYVLWTGKSSGSDKSELVKTPGGAGTETVTSGGSASFTKTELLPEASIFSGTTLALPATQTVNNYNSFAANANIAVMKAGDSCLKSVFGYLRYRIPLSNVDNYATIKSITISADEDIAGRVEINYTGDEPVATIVANGSKTVTVNTRWQTNSPAHYEPGIYFAVLPVGTYHNVSIEITPLAYGTSTDSTATKDPFTIYCRGDVVVERGKYTDLGTLPIAESASSNPGFKFDTDLFQEFTDPVSGVVSYQLKSEALGWDNSQSPYYVTKAMTNDERFIFFMVSANEFRPSYHSLSKYERSAKILDLETRKLYTFYATDGCYPYMDPVNDKIYYCILNDTRTAAKFYMRDLLNAPDVEVPLADFPQQLLSSGGTIKRVCSHLTLTQDKTKVFLDSRVGDTFYQGLLDLYSGVWTEWSHNSEVNLTHGQLNPTRDDEALLAVDGWDDTSGVHHSIVKDPDGEFNGDGTYPRMQIMTSDGNRRTIRPSDPWNGATHDGWHPDGNHLYWCAGMHFDNQGNPILTGGTATGGFHTRSIRNESEYVYYVVGRATHCFLSEDWFTNENKMYAVYDDDRPYGPYTTGYYRGGPWKVWFYNAQTQKEIAIYSGMVPYAMDPAKESRIHPDPHPNFVVHDKYVICTAYGSDGNLHLSITPVDQLITKSLEN
ncbi:MAG: hypothetical protein J5737_04270 [Bacteroidales bacterium]|nr:hypothetical protein [Bacteroidales bacterium]